MIYDTYDTIGDETEIECPHCRKIINLSDITTDGCLEPDYKSDCPHCGREWIIWDVQYSATVYAKKA